ncbi:hypothetical protein ASPSYDRAFT_70795 [Aspergillus sydowii CBS 593.65]|uniref:Uncharacterized protein n=1 Tax=Aspergillus sydowii CBS 593.65 TaxID=1036612 RepID=A0A1L9T9E7_9EURO|nr:uncharacterized protein ASPSYDRAFT_70795 [Aspergillus sydowii CBS 593.65]OJJ55923.1 hypothetical protein ASPSYDRAFT_70795 [Aspergillus sydowii CBS 593.65]
MAGHGIVSEIAVNSPEHGFLGRLAPSIERYAYQGRSQYIEFFESRRKDWFENPAEIPDLFMVTNITNDIFEQIFLPAAEAEDDDSPVARWISYDATLELLLIRVGKSAIHEYAAGAFDTILFEAIEPTALGRRQFCSFDSTQCRAAEGAKEADKAWIPFRMPRGRNRDWPSAVLEVAFSETQSKLQSDVRYWQRASAGKVRIVFALRIGRAREREITIEQWVFEDGHYHRQGVVALTRLQNGTTNVRGAPITVEFEKLYLRAPATPSEHKAIEINEEKFEFLAERIWTAQDEEQEKN